MTDTPIPTPFGGDQAELPDMPPRKVYVGISASGTDTWLDAPWSELEPGTPIIGEFNGHIGALGLKDAEDGPKPYITIKLDDINITSPETPADPNDLEPT